MRISVPVEFVPTQSVWWIDSCMSPPDIYPAKISRVWAHTSDSMCSEVFVEYEVVIFEKKGGKMYAQKRVRGEDLRKSREEAIDAAIAICEELKKEKVSPLDSRIKQLKQMKG